MTLSEGFFSFLECLRTSLQNKCVILEHAIFVEALTVSVHFHTIVFNAFAVMKKVFRYVGAKFLFLHI